MLHPLFSTVIQRPDLVADHISGYAALIDQEAKAIGSNVMARLVTWVIVLLSGFLFLSLAGIALMLGFLQNQFHWVLIVIPGLAFMVTVASFIKASKPTSHAHFPELKAQVECDIQALRTAVSGS